MDSRFRYLVTEVAVTEGIAPRILHEKARHFEDGTTTIAADNGSAALGAAHRPTG